MKPKNSYVIFIFLECIIVFGGCKVKPTPAKIETYLGVSFPASVIEKDFFIAEYSPDYRKPYNVYGRYKMSVTDLRTIVKRLKLIDQAGDYIQLMCLDEISINSLPFDLWSFRTRFDYFYREDLALNLKWWKPEEDRGSLYAAFYKEKGTKRTIRCYREKWDGRVLASYNDKSGEAYILIEILL